MKIILSRIFIFCFLFSFHFSFAQNVTKKRGRVTTYYADGKKESSGKVKHSKKVGLWKYFYEDGKLEKTIKYKDDSKEGLYTAYYANGQKSQEGNYVDDEKIGTWNSWYANGKIKSKLNHSNSCDSPEEYECYDGLQQWWYENGQLSEQDSCHDSNYYYKWTWYENAKPKSVNYFIKSAESGQWRTYSDSLATDTFPTTIINYANGKKNGDERDYKKGILIEESNFKDDLLDGKVKIWDFHGTLGVVCNYKDGKLDGDYTVYKNGIPIQIIPYANAEKNGEEKDFDEDGKVTNLTWYKNGKIDSTNSFHPNGIIATSRVYSYLPGFVHTEEFSVYREFDEKGILLLIGEYHFEQKDQNWTTFYPNGKIKSITIYSAGKIKGVYKKYYSNGKEMIEYECDGSSVITQPKVWGQKGNPIKPKTKAWQEIVDSSLPGETYEEPQKVERR